tara:strand:+ start:822 stop:1568 length:747 start_codon:yes stop_codon:yes gene_type:complete
MSTNLDDLNIGGQLQVGTGIPPAIKQGDEKINGSMHVEGPVVLGDPLTFSEADATVMITSLKNDDKDCPQGVFNSLTVDGHQTINNGNLHTSNLLACTGQACAWSGSSINVQGWKGFDIKHPTKDNYRLRYVCLEGPEGGVYYRGKVINKNVIQLPDYWKDLVDHTTITVSLTPIGAHQDLIVKRVEPTQIHLQSKGGIPIHAFFHVFGARADGEALTPEYYGQTPEDYPGKNDQYSIAGYHYDRRTL